MTEQVEEAPKATPTPRKARARKVTPEAPVTEPLEPPEAPEPPEAEASPWPAENAWWVIVQHSVGGDLDPDVSFVRIEGCRVCSAMVDYDGYEEHLVWHARRG